VAFIIFARFSLPDRKRIPKNDKKSLNKPLRPLFQRYLYDKGTNPSGLMLAGATAEGVAEFTELHTKKPAPIKNRLAKNETGYPVARQPDNL